MTINPVLFGVLATISVELFVGFVAIIYYAITHKK